MSAPPYEAVIGLEVHVQLRTRSKIFCGCSTQFGAAPNTQVCPVCLGHPGVLPVLNRGAVTLALRWGLAVDAVIGRHSVFARKNYFYPDLPKGYQISQYDRPVIEGGALIFPHGDGERSVRLERAHLEEDAGKSFHSGAGEDPTAGPRTTRVDLNRCGVPLLEIVTEPDLRSATEAHDFLVRLRQLVVYLDICDGNLEEGSLRCDANISLRPQGSENLNPKTEIKNLNSFRHVEQALTHELDRQTKLHAAGTVPEQATRLWDEHTGATRVMRTKEDAPDYRYFPEPDLPPLIVDAGWIAQVSESMPELPAAKEQRFVDAYGLTRKTARSLTTTRKLADYYERVAAAAGDGEAAAKWVQNETLRLVKETPGGLADLAVTAESLGRLVRMVGDGVVSASSAKTVLAEMERAGGDPREIVEARGLRLQHDPEEVRRAAQEALDEHPGQVEQYLQGKEALVQFFVGQVMKRLRGRAQPREVSTAVSEALERRREKGS